MKKITLLMGLTLLAACAAPAPTPTKPVAVAQPVASTVAPVPTMAPSPTVAVAAATSVPTPKPPPPKITVNLTDGCAPSYDENTDYFPEKLQITQATNLKIEYFKNYKLVTISNPWRGAKEQFTYALVQCGTPAPKNLPANVTVIEVPVKRIITLSTTEVAALDRIDATDRIVALDDFTYVSNSKVRELIKAGKLKEVGAGPTINLEQVLTLKPDVLFTSGIGSAEYDTHPKLIEAKVKVGIDASYMEQSPLGRAEWSKYFALFLNREGQAITAFNEVQDKYNAIANKMKAVGKKPTVFNGLPYKDTWSISGGQSYAARFIADAGGQHLWADDPSTGSIPLKLEQVLAKAAKADYWLLNAFEKPADVKALLKIDSRFGSFTPTKTGNIWNFDKRVNENGGNDYYETGSANPQLILADLAKAFHPDLMKNHQFVFYRQLGK